MKLQITKNGTQISISFGELEKLQDKFNKKHCILLPNFIHPELMELIQEKIEQSKFTRMVYKGIGEDIALKNKKIKNVLNLLLNNEEIFNVVEKITGCDKIASFKGRVYRFIPGHGHLDNWHNDLMDNRLVAISINLSTDVFSGGVLQIRNRENEKIICQLSNTGIGNAVIFRISPTLQHKVTCIQGRVSRTAFAGWFRGKLRSKPLKGKAFHMNKPVNSPTPSLKDEISVSEEILTQKSKENSVLINIESGDYYTLDPTSSRIWDFLLKVNNIRKVYNMLKNEYEVSDQLLKNDLLKQIQSFQKLGLIKVQN